MATQAVTDLCRVVLSDIYGDVAEKIVGSLLENGRLTPQQIAKTTDLAISTVKGALVALLQNRFVLYWIDPVNKKQCFYSANWKEILKVLETGQVLNVVADRFSGENTKAPEIVKNIMVYGHIRAKEYLEQIEETNGQALENGYTTKVDNLKNPAARVMTELVSKRYLTPLFDFDFQPEDDIFQQLLKKHYSKVSRNQSENARMAAATASARKERDELYGTKDAENAGLIPVESQSKKAMPGTKRARRNPGFNEPKFTVDPETVLAVNHDKFLLAFRSEELTKLALKTIGPVTAAVYRQLLECYERKLRRCSQKVTQTADFFITTMSIMQGLDPDLDLKDSIVMPSFGRKRREMEEDDSDAELNANPKRLRADTGGFILTADDGDEDGDEDGDAYNESETTRKKISIVDVTRHLDLLAASPLKLVIRAGNRGGGEWYVPFDDLRETLKRVSYEQIIENKLGPLAIRLFRIIKDKGMVNDEMLARTALLRADTIAQLAATLHDFGALDLQEVPRSNDRTPVKTFFLWFHNPKRSYNIILQDIYKGLSRMYKRIISERKEHSILLGKLEREDVKENEDQYLTESEKQEIKELRSAEEKLLVQIGRLQTLARIFDEY